MRIAVYKKVISESVSLEKEAAERWRFVDEDFDYAHLDDPHVGDVDDSEE